MVAYQMLTLTEAVSMLDGGAKFGDVYPYLEDSQSDGERLRMYFVYGRLPEPRMCADPENTPLPQGWLKTPPKEQMHLSSIPTGDMCRHCGGLTTRTGTCVTCQSCGDSSGGCG